MGPTRTRIAGAPTAGTPIPPLLPSRTIQDSRGKCWPLAVHQNSHLRWIVAHLSSMPRNSIASSRLDRPHEAMPFSEKCEEDGLHTGGTNPSCESTNWDDKSRRRKKDARPLPLSARLAKKVKIVFPHVALSVMVFAYMTAGAAVLQWLENREALANDDHSLAKQPSQPKALLARTIEEVANVCTSSVHLHCQQRVDEISNLLRRTANQCQQIPCAVSQLPYWSYRMSFLYILTVVTTTD